VRELKSHAPFTFFGSITGIIIMAVITVARVKPDVLKPAFEGFHAMHVLLSALVTAAMYRRYRKGLVAVILIGYAGSVGIATVSDIVLPHHGGALLLRIAGEHRSHMQWHLPCIEEWWLITPAALLGIGLAIWKPVTKCPHAGHVLLSTWASLFHLVAYAEGPVNWLPLLPLALVVLFVAVWVPCCFSDIVFPLLFVRSKTPEKQHA
jgi:hypothetical protein